MIKSKKELREYLAADKKALRRTRKRPKLTDYIWRYEILLRKCEYYQNTNNKSSPLSMLARYQRAKLGAICGFTIPLNVVDKGLCLVHIGPVIISEFAKVGQNCRIHVGVNIGADARISDAAPVIGNNVYIGPGAKLFGNITVADQIAIGANAVVTKSFTEECISVAGVPAKKISDVGTDGIIEIE